MTGATNGKIMLAIVDLAGTTVDYGSCAPAGAFVELFRRHGVEATQEEARMPMGLHKRDHIAAMTRMPRIEAAWRERHGAAPDDAQIDAMYQEFIPLQVRCLPDYGQAIPGVVDTVGRLRVRGIRVAATTGYNREMLEVVLGSVAPQGFVPDAAFCAEDVAGGRPAPWMIFRCMEATNVYPPEAVVNFGDTVPDVASGCNAGVWSIGVTRTGNMIGLPREAEAALDADDRARRLRAADKTMTDAGAHFVIESFADCMNCIDQIETRLAGGERP